MSEWIKCSERMPPINYVPKKSGYCDGWIKPDVFIVYNNQVVRAALWAFENCNPCWYIPFADDPKNIPIIKYWMPMPELPED